MTRKRFVKLLMGCGASPRIAMFHADECRRLKKLSEAAKTEPRLFSYQNRYAQFTVWLLRYKMIKNQDMQRQACRYALAGWKNQRLHEEIKLREKAGLNDEK